MAGMAKEVSIHAFSHSSATYWTNEGEGFGKEHGVYS